MPKKAAIDRPVNKTISLPSSLCARIDLLLYSELEGRVPFAAWRNYIKELVEKDLQARGIK